MQTIDINTSLEADDSTTPPTPAGATYRPLRYTTRVADEIRIGVWELLSTDLGTYRLDITQGLDFVALMDSGSSDDERSAAVSAVVLKYPGVTAITAGPTVTVVDGTLINISLEADTIDGPISIGAAA